MFEIGPSLREARTRRGFSSEDVQKAIRIRDRYLHALEEEKWELLPGDAYVKGFLRTYAEYLGLNGSLYVDEYNSRFAQHDEQSLVPEAMPPMDAARLGLLRPLAVIAAIVAVVAAVAAWQLRSSPSTPTAASSHTSGGSATSTPPPAPATHHSSTTSTHKPATPKKKPTRAATQTVTASRAVLVATRGRVWLQVREGGASGPLLFEGTLDQGKTLPVKLSPKVWLRVGAPWNLDVRIGGKIAAGMPHQPSNLLITAAGITPAA